MMTRVLIVLVVVAATAAGGPAAAQTSLGSWTAIVSNQYRIVNNVTYLTASNWEAKLDKDTGNLTWAFDIMAVQVFLDDPKPRILQKRLLVNDFGFSPVAHITGSLADPKYAGAQDQSDTSTEIAAGPDTYCENGY